MLKWSFYGLVALMVAALTANHFANGGQGYLTVPQEVYYGVLAAALVVPVFWAIAHLGLAVIMGVSGGGLKEGIKLGLMLGIGMALGRSWLNVAALGAGVAVGNGPLLWAIGAGVLAVFLFALDWAMGYIWRMHKDGANL